MRGCERAGFVLLHYAVHVRFVAYCIMSCDARSVFRA